MGRSESETDSSYERRKKKKKKKSEVKDRRSISRPRDRRSRSRDRRSRSREHKKSRKSRSRDRRRSRSRSTERNRDRPRERIRGSKRPRTRSKSRSRSKGGERSNENSRSREAWIFESQTPKTKIDGTLTLSEELKRARAISDIDGESFVQSDFRTDHMAKLGDGAKEIEKGEMFDFGTSAETISSNKETGNIDSDYGLAHAKLFGDQAKREKRYLLTIFALRQAALARKTG